MHRHTGIAVLLAVGMLGSGCSTFLRPLKGNGSNVSAFSSRQRTAAFGSAAASTSLFPHEPVAPAPKPVEPKVAVATVDPDEGNPYAEHPAPAPASPNQPDVDALLDFSAPSNSSATRAGFRRMQEDPQFARLNEELLKLDQAERDYRKATRLELKSACARHKAKACELLERRSRNADARHALERKYRASAG